MFEFKQVFQRNEHELRHCVCVTPDATKFVIIKILSVVCEILAVKRKLSASSIHVDLKQI